MSERKRPNGIDRLRTATLVALAAAAALLLLGPLARISALPSLNYNEGWNAYRDRMAFLGRPLYAAPPRFAVTNYPFLSFHAVGAFGALIGDTVLAGRIVALASLLATALLAGATVRALTGSGRASVYAGLCLLVWIATFTPERRAMDDPGLLACAVAAFGLLAAAGSGPRGDRRGVGRRGASGAIFAVALFVKPDVLALPLAVVADLALARRWRDLAAMAASGAVTASVLLALTFRLDGPWFLAHLLRPRAYLPANLAANGGAYLLRFGAPLAVASVALWRHAPADRRRFLLLLVLATNGASVLFGGGDGVARNVFYPALIALAVAAGVALRSVEPVGAGPRRRRRLPAAAVIVPALAGLAAVPFVLAADIAAWRRAPAVAGDARRAIALLRAAGPPAMCEDILLCFRAGEPIGPDAFFVHDQLATGRLRDRDIVAELASHRFRAIEIDGRVDGAAPRARRRFDAAFMRALGEDYRIVSTRGAYTVLAPRPSVPADHHRQ